ncbi:unnamed protein product, partial [Nesidiocoris tenuis]
KWEKSPNRRDSGRRRSATNTRAPSRLESIERRIAGKRRHFGTLRRRVLHLWLSRADLGHRSSRLFPSAAGRDGRGTY